MLCTPSSSTSSFITPYPRKVASLRNCIHSKVCPQRASTIMLKTRNPHSTSRYVFKQQTQISSHSPGALHSPTMVSQTPQHKGASADLSESRSESKPSTLSASRPRVWAQTNGFFFLPPELRFWVHGHLISYSPQDWPNGTFNYNCLINREWWSKGSVSGVSWVKPAHSDLFRVCSRLSAELSEAMPPPAIFFHHESTHTFFRCLPLSRLAAAVIQAST